MILYQIATKMEEYARLKQSIRESGGDVSFMIEEKTEIEQSMLSQASKWEAEEQLFT